MTHKNGWQNEGNFVGLDVDKFKFYVFISKTSSNFSVLDTLYGHAKLQNVGSGSR